MITFLISFAAWAVPATALCVLIARWNRRSRAEHQNRMRALKARQAARHASPTPSWARTDRHGDHR
ncbi:hypothetical protein [Streptomyces sp. NPDC056387]|uniref:hypothetical protein n=1 Tax=Streptomyces sp. NPDC056387 TaxID=3345803 RepID=UPI0035D823B5